MIPAILILKKTFGRHKNGKLLYKCLPNDMALEPIVVPYEIKNVGFSKVFSNQYVLIDYENKVLAEVFGDVNNIENYYRYQLYCRNLHIPTMKLEKEFAGNYQFKTELENRNHFDVFSIDGPTTTDYDDAFSVQVFPNRMVISIYISNVCLYADEAKIWDLFSEHISNIYLPNRRITLLPEEMIRVFSLTADKSSVALALDIHINSTHNKIIKTEYRNVIINPYKNYSYTDSELEDDDNYQNLECAIQLMANDSQYEKYKIQTDEDLEALGRTRAEYNVEYLMRYMSFDIGRVLSSAKTGIFRTINEPLEDIYPSNSYINCHDIVNKPYVHITSPIRRIVDILNSIKLQQLMNVYISNEANEFYNRWAAALDYINIMAKNIRRIQNECALLNLYPTICDKEFDGKFIEMTRENEMYIYTVYLIDLRLTAKIKSLVELDETPHKYKLFMFGGEAKFKRKIRLHLVAAIN